MLKTNYTRLAQYSITLFTILFLFSCSSIKQTKKEEEKEVAQTYSKDTFELINFRKNLNSIKCSGEIEFANTSQNMSGSFELKMIRNQSVLMDLFGPLGINVARIYANADSLLIYNLWSGKYYQTKGSLDGFEFISPFVSKLFSVLIAEPFYEKDSLLKITPAQDSLAFNKRISGNENYYFKYLRKRSSMNYLVYNYDSSKYEVYFRSFEKTGNFDFPSKIDIYDLNNKNQLKLQIEKFDEINQIKSIQNNHKSKFTKVKKIEDLF